MIFQTTKWRETSGHIINLNSLCILCTQTNCCQAADCLPDIQQPHANTSIRFPQRPLYRDSHSPGVVWYIFLHWPRPGCPPRSAGCECSLRYGWSRYPSGTTFQIIGNNWVGAPLDPSSHREHRLYTWAHLHVPRRPSVGASHRAPSSDLSYMSFTQRMLLGSWRPSAWAFISMRMIHSSTAAAWPQMRKHYRDWSSVPSRQFVCVDGFKQASTKSGQNSYHLVRYETTTREAELRSTVFGVANSSVRHTRPEPRGHPGQWAADGGPHLTAMSFLFFPAASFARDSPLSHAEIDSHAHAQLHLQQDRLL